MASNLDARTISGFADEWMRLDQSELGRHESRELFANYFRIFPWAALPIDAGGFDMGCGSGRWAFHVAPRVGQLHCIDASAEVVGVARRNLRGSTNCVFHVASVDELPLDEASMDFGYCLGVLHHVPNPVEGLRSCVTRLKPGAPFLVYLYYAFDNRPAWFRAVWKVTDLLRRALSRSPSWLRYSASQVIAATVYFPLARAARLAERLGWSVAHLPLSYYRNRSFYTMRTDALDRFGTFLEHRFTALEIEQMMAGAGLERITFSDAAPYWCALGYRQF